MIDVIDLKKSFGTNEVLKGIDLTVNKGDIVCILGPSGSGKSTLLRCLNCMEDPTSGSIIFNGVDIADMRVDINIHRRHMGMVFQQFNLFNNKTVIQNIMLAPVFVGMENYRKAKRHNAWTKFANTFRKEKKPLVEIAETPAQIKENAKANALRLLSGMAVSALFGAFNDIIKTLFAESLGNASGFLVGGLNGCGWKSFQMILPYALAGLLVCLFLPSKMNISSAVIRDSTFFDTSFSLTKSNRQPETDIFLISNGKSIQLFCGFCACHSS